MKDGGFDKANNQGEFYGKSGSDNPVTIKFQEGRGIKKKSANDGIIYDENESYVESRISKRELSFGSAGKSKLTNVSRRL